MMHTAQKGLLCNLQTTQAQISLRISAGWSGPSLSVYWINGYCSICRQTENVKIRLHGCACSSGHSLFTYAKGPFSHVAHHLRLIALDRMPWSFRQIFCLFLHQLWILLYFRHYLERGFLLGVLFLNDSILFWLTISYQKPFAFPVSVFYSQIFTLKLNLRPKIGLTYAISIVKWLFGIFV